MEHPFKPIQAFKKFKKNSYSERFEFREKQDAADKIEHHSNELKREFLKVGTKISNELNSHSLASRHFQFFVKNIPIKEQADKV